MRVSTEHERLVRMLKESISLMCKNALTYDVELNVEGLLGITLDKRDIFLININESFQSAALRLAEAEAGQNSGDDVEITNEEGMAVQPKHAKRKRKRRSSRESPVPNDDEPSENHNSNSFSQDFAEGELSHMDSAGMSSSVPQYPADSHISRNQNVLTSSRAPIQHHQPQQESGALSDPPYSEDAAEFDLEGMVIKEETVRNAGKGEPFELAAADEASRSQPQFPGSIPIAGMSGSGDDAQSSQIITVAYPRGETFSRLPQRKPVTWSEEGPRTWTEEGPRAHLDPKANYLMWSFLMHPGPVIASRGLSRSGPLAVRELNQQQLLAVFDLLECHGVGRKLAVSGRRTKIFAKELPRDVELLEGGMVMENMSFEQYERAFWENPKYVNKLSAPLSSTIRRTVEEAMGGEYVAIVSAVLDWADPKPPGGATASV